MAVSSFCCSNLPTKARMAPQGSQDGGEFVVRRRCRSAVTAPLPLLARLLDVVAVLGEVEPDRSTERP